MHERKKTKRVFLYLVACVVGLIVLIAGLWLTQFVSDVAQQGGAFALIICLGYLWFRRIRRGDAVEIEIRRNPESAYFILGVDSNADDEQIRRAYRALARQQPPDHFPDAEKPAADSFLARVHRAYQIIGNEDARFDYDMYVKSCGEFPHLDQAHAFVQQRREALGDMFEDDEQETSEVGPEELAIPAGSSDQAPIGQRCDHPSEPVSRTNSDGVATGESPHAQLSPTSSAECSACGETYQISLARTGPFHCDYCGEELPSISSTPT